MPGILVYDGMHLKSLVPKGRVPPEIAVGNYAFVNNLEIRNTYTICLNIFEEFGGLPCWPTGLWWRHRLLADSHHCPGSNPGLGM